MLKKHLPAEKKKLMDPPPYRYLDGARAGGEQEIYFHRQGRGAGDHPPGVRHAWNTTRVTRSRRFSCTTNYFAGGMAGIVFQELREARALAYFAGARYATGSRKADQDIMLGLIQSQNDKTPEALTAFVDLMDNLPESEQRFETARQSLISQYRTGKIGFRSIIGSVRNWSGRGLRSIRARRGLRRFSRCRSRRCLRSTRKLSRTIRS